MMGRSHALSGAAVWLLGTAGVHALGAHPSLFGTALGTAVCAAAALVPDLDHPSSRATKAAGLLTLGLSVVLRWLSRTVYAATRFPADRNNGTGHRALTHTGVFALAAGVLTSVALLVASVWVPALASVAWLGGPVAAGCLTHDLGDALTVAGVPLLWPRVIRERRWYPVGPKLIHTDDGWERRLVWPLLVVGVAAGGFFSVV